MAKKFCAHCGTKRKEGNKFCRECGIPFDPNLPVPTSPRVSGMRADLSGPDLVKLKDMLNRNRDVLRDQEALWSVFKKDLSRHDVHKKMVELQDELEDLVTLTYLDLSTVERDYYVKEAKQRLQLELAEKQLNQVLEMLVGWVQKTNEMAAKITQDEERREEIGNLIFEEIVLAKCKGLVDVSKQQELEDEAEQIRLVTRQAVRGMLESGD